SPSSGASIIASLFERAATETGSVQAIRLRDATTPTLRLVQGEATIVIDAGSVGESWLFEDAVRQATDLIVVTRLGMDTVQNLFPVRSATAASDAPLAAVMTYRPWRPFSRSDRDAVVHDAEPTDSTAQ